MVLNYSGTIEKEVPLEIPINDENIQDNVDKVHEVADNKFGRPGAMTAEEVLGVEVDVPDLVVPVLVVGDHVLEVLYEPGDPVVVGELVHHVWQVEGCCLEEEQVGDPLVVGVVDYLGVLVPRSYSRMSHSMLVVWECECVCYVAVGVECCLAHLSIICIPVN